ncbi:pitrilysin family protein [Luteolibacter sp. SL250]|uniref:M16 family metallopeptidase n=1 Tax=Luteolibacter sp. SL250 TaxID=2995170 RepID=UPI002270701C|nr:pitrilysin family protein [Luteolibacter sp. SL250]WAC20310.1 pitrilysin family protein [Luteolibacter sp. SL250]
MLLRLSNSLSKLKSMEYPPTTATVDTLPNGFTVILDPDPAAPVVSAQIWVESGSVHEDRHLGSGLSHFLEHMVFKGTRDYSADELADTVQAAGGHWNAYTTFDRTVYYIDGPSESLPTFLKTLTGLVFYPTIPQTEFEREKDVIRREIDMGLDDPDNASTRLLLSTAFTRDPRRHPVIGHRHLFDTLTHEDMLDYHRTRYTPDRAFAVISGDFDPVEALRQITELTADRTVSAGRDPVVPQDNLQLGPRFARETFAIPTSRISLAWKCPALDHADSPAFDLLAAILGRGRSSRLHLALRERQELALEISAYAWTGPGREGIFGVSADAAVDNRDTLITAIHRELSLIQDADLEEDLAKAKRQTATSQFRSLTTASGRASDLASNWHETRDLDFTRRYLAQIQKVTAEDVRHAAATLTKERVTLTLLDPEGSPAPVRHSKSAQAKAAIETFTLPNGLQIALLPDHRVPLIHLQAAIRAGLPSETPATNGINQLLASSLPKGTATRSAEEIARTMESIGASIGASVGNNALLVAAAGLAPDFRTIAEVFAEVICSPSLPEDSIAREKASQLAALEEALQDPLHTGFATLRQLAFQGTGYGFDSLGSLSSLPQLGRADLAAHHARHFTARNMTLAIAGDFDPEQAKSILSSAFAGLPSGEAWTPPGNPPATGQETTAHLPKKQAVLTIGFPGASVTSADRYALSMIQEYATDMAGPLFTRIREELGLAYRVGATQFLGFDAGYFTFYVATSPEQAEFAGRELMTEIGKIAEHGIPEAAFGRVRATVLSSLAIQQQSPSSTARQVALDLLFGQEAEQFRKQAAIYKALEPDKVKEAAARLLSAAPVRITVLPEPSSITA